MFLPRELAGLRRFPEAIAAPDRALVKADEGGERYHLAELLRLNAEFLFAELEGEGATAVEACFQAAQDRPLSRNVAAGDLP